MGEEKKSQEEVKQKSAASTETLMRRLEALEAELAAEKASKVEFPKSYTAGKQPIDELAGFVPRREPVVSKLQNGTKRVDY